ncbi:ABC-type nitrate/sulfonate/bicarbonate transport system, ATPase component [Chthonomonas calidirosea]|uniref:ABC transporter ATP-binding protein n=1 Tax=Chthonomonas calidirosea TaxID=454171 RepID=UPI0006DD528C|nr:ABC transporter ATP-binding protein [Chthonomonas calidirosea]CEK16863.1 ABC-type nitrate/sulfonate/bicarbonate transport system, ATPase component [Chthonomonas calidirosea]
MTRSDLATIHTTAQIQSSDVPAVAIKQLEHAYGNLSVIENFNLEIRRHEFLAIVGPSGCGKTTLLSLISGYEQPTKGSIARLGEVRMIYQQGGLFPWLTVAENIGLGLRRLPNAKERQKKLEEMLALVELPMFADSYPHQLSGGMKQRVELARALADDSDILLMDEPFSSLDYIARLQLRQELGRILSLRPRTVVLVTHDLEEAAHLADRVIVLSERPARIQCELVVNAPRPRNLTHPAVIETTQRLLIEMGLEGAPK